MTSHSDVHDEDEGARLHEARMHAHLAARLRAAGGWLTFEEFMRELLYAPGLGYYSAGAHKLGAAGDFTTAPEISRLFGECVARQCAQVLRATGGDILELGAGSGRLACDVLVALEQRERILPERYLVLEVSADLRERQRASVASLPAALAARVQWLQEPPRAAWRGLLLANEVLDALPCRRFRIAADAVAGTAVEELGVALDGEERPRWSARAADEALASEVERIERELPVPFAAGYESELCTMLAPLVASVTDTLERGVALFTDYGLARRDYYHPDRARGTLRCHRRHLAHDDPFVHPGTQDVTAWVDFTRLAEAADAAGLEVLGFATQAAFLLGCGIEGRLAAVEDPVQHARLVSEARQLLLPGEMGETFKALALGRRWSEPLAGFAVQDLRARL